MNYLSKTHFLLLLIVLWTLSACVPSNQKILPIPSTEPNEAQLKQIQRKYGMFIHFGVNTFHDMGWTNGTKPVSSYQPASIDAEQWIKAAKDAGMKYVILISKHHDGFCLWDSKYTEYDVANSGNPTNVIEAVAKACQKYDIGLGLYYSLWDRNFNGNQYINDEDKHPHHYPQNPELDQRYNAYMLKQLDELMDITQPYTPIVEFWFDGGWTKKSDRWPVADMYHIIKSREPECQIGINWSIGQPENPEEKALPEEQQAGYPIRYFPSDFRLGDPLLPAENDPKVFSHGGENYYMPWESTVCISNKWFYHTTDSTFKSIDELEVLYQKATAQDNILILNCPPNREGRLREKDIEILLALKERLQL